MTNPQQPSSNIDLQAIAEKSGKILNKFMEQQKSVDMEGSKHITDAFMKMAETWAQDPQQVIKMQMDLYQQYLGLWANMADRMMGKEVEPAIQPQRGDKRFNSEEWENNLVFDYIKQSYLLTSNWMTSNIENTSDIDEKTKAKVDFYTRQFMDAVSPSNFASTNPEVIKATMDSKGQNLVDGLNNLLNDLERGDGKLKISMTDYDAFEIGKNIATTEGEVIYQNRMMQLIQYKPKGKQVYGRPLIIYPPWINKFYILDLQAKNSFVKYAVEECGLQVFLVSWKNPDENYRDVGFEQYLEEGILDSIEQVTQITGSKDVNAIGYCIGGTLLTMALAYMAKVGDKRINSATYFTSLMDFSEAGELSLFTDKEQVSSLEKKMNEKGYLEGSEMAGVFSMLRANDLIWSFVVNNYLLGKDPFPFDLLYWNDDPTRMPAKMHSEYLNNMYIENNLIKKDKMEMLDQKLDIRKIATPIYMVSALNDHITPWESCFSPLKDLQSEVRFILGKAGHVAGVACPPGNPKRAYWSSDLPAKTNTSTKQTGKATNTNKEQTDLLRCDAQAWLKSAEMNHDSWWSDWKVWIAKKSGKKIPAPKTMGDAKHKAIEPAPGSYVKER